ncbi:hypothetical protein AAFF_G00113560 [Aldrovandia affinis]|uniref:Uncharacterized protein n=1 Tax=Aldrovandia affinis TaxID=143900 RepID=A0AAD7RTD6_9TELE|nr:hypothetical protein AAFF_G00113560 [Aldrovandia affinis]
MGRWRQAIHNGNDRDEGPVHQPFLSSGLEQRAPLGRHAVLPPKQSRQTGAGECPPGKRGGREGPYNPQQTARGDSHPKNARKGQIHGSAVKPRHRPLSRPPRTIYPSPASVLTHTAHCDPSAQSPPLTALRPEEKGLP